METVKFTTTSISFNEVRLSGEEVKFTGSEVVAIPEGSTMIETLLGRVESNIEVFLDGVSIGMGTVQSNG